VKLLLDAHTLIWAVEDPSKLGPRAAVELKEPANELLLSAGTIWELAIKVGIGKLGLSLPYGLWMDKAIADLGIVVLPIRVGHAETVTQLPGRGDPFDRLLVAQCIVENMSIASNDSGLDQHGVQRVW
jgi:PIN domain nuclease of toxin-antitoxin system